jgi:hypothetical protein
MNLFTSRQFQDNSRFADIVRRIVSVPEGYRSYPSRVRSEAQDVSKKVFWQSVSLYGTEWRLVAVHAERDPSGKAGGHAGKTAAPELKLDSLAATNSLIAALAQGDKKSALTHFRNFYGETPGIYSVQWMDEKGVNRFGYPAENSLTDYDYHTCRAASDTETLRILAGKKPATMETSLFEGGTGIFTFRPVFSGQRYLGMVYFIRIKPAVTGPGEP